MHDMMWVDECAWRKHAYKCTYANKCSMVSCQGAWAYVSTQHEHGHMCVYVSNHVGMPSWHASKDVRGHVQICGI